MSLKTTFLRRRCVYFAKAAKKIPIKGFFAPSIYRRVEIGMHYGLGLRSLLIFHERNDGSVLFILEMFFIVNCEGCC